MHFFDLTCVFLVDYVSSFFSTFTSIAPLSTFTSILSAFHQHFLVCSYNSMSSCPRVFPPPTFTFHLLFLLFPHLLLAFITTCDNKITFSFFYKDLSILTTNIRMPGRTASFFLARSFFFFRDPHFVDKMQIWEQKGTNFALAVVLLEVLLVMQRKKKSKK